MAYVRLWLIILAFSTGCAAMLTGQLPPNKYGPLGRRGGYSQTQLSNDRYLVFFMGSWSKKERVADLALLRAAELTRAREYSRFKIISENTYTEGIDKSSGAAIPVGPIAISGTASSERFTTQLLIQLLPGTASDTVAVHSAEVILDKIATKHKVSL